MTIKGQELKITPSSLSDAFALQKALAKSLKETSSEVSIDGVESLENSVEKLLPMLLNGLMTVVISDDVESALFKCAEKALLGKEKINRDFFEDLENRGYYFQIMFEIIKVNVGPFFKNLSSLLPGDLGGKISGILKSRFPAMS